MSHTIRFRALASTLRTPGHRRSMLVRRLLALALLGAAALSILSSRSQQPETIVFARDVAAGSLLRPGDLALRRLPRAAVPESALHDDPADYEGRVVVAAAAQGEVLTPSRVLGEELVADLLPSPPGGAGARAHLVPVKLAEPDIIPHLHHGDEVDVVTAAPVEGAGQATVVAPGGRIATTGTGEGREKSSTVVLVLPESLAVAVAAASLNQPLTVVIVGERATGGAAADN